MGGSVNQEISPDTERHKRLQLAKRVLKMLILFQSCGKETTKSLTTKSTPLNLTTFHDSRPGVFRHLILPAISVASLLCMGWPVLSSCLKSSA